MASVGNRDALSPPGLLPVSTGWSPETHDHLAISDVVVAYGNSSIPAKKAPDAPGASSSRPRSSSQNPERTMGASPHPDAVPRSHDLDKSPMTRLGADMSPSPSVPGVASRRPTYPWCLPRAGECDPSDFALLRPFSPSLPPRLRLPTQLVPGRCCSWQLIDASMRPKPARR